MPQRDLVLWAFEEGKRRRFAEVRALMKKVKALRLAEVQRILRICKR